MEIHVNDLETTVDVLPDAALLDPALIRRIVDEVAQELRRREVDAAWARRERSAEGRGGEVST